MKHDDFSGILQCVRAFCDAEALLTPLAAGKPLHLAAAVSGGADSMALLRVLLPKPAPPRVPVLLQPELLPGLQLLLPEPALPLPVSQELQQALRLQLRRS